MSRLSEFEEALLWEMDQIRRILVMVHCQGHELPEPHPLVAKAEPTEVDKEAAKQAREAAANTARQREADRQARLAAAG